MYTMSCLLSWFNVYVTCYDFSWDFVHRWAGMKLDSAKVKKEGRSSCGSFELDDWYLPTKLSSDSECITSTVFTLQLILDVKLTLHQLLLVCTPPICIFAITLVLSQWKSILLLKIQWRQEIIVLLSRVFWFSFYMDLLFHWTFMFKCMISEVLLCFWNGLVKLIVVNLRGKDLHASLEVGLLT